MFGEIEAIMDFELPASARLHRPWWSNQTGGSGHSQAFAWGAAGWETAEVDGAVVTDLLLSLCREVAVGGRQIHDANIVATMLT